MLTISTTLDLSQSSLWGGLRDLYRRWAHRVAMHHLYRATLRELSNLSDHELSDTGLEETPWQGAVIRQTCDRIVRPSRVWPFPGFVQVQHRAAVRAALKNRARKAVSARAAEQTLLHSRQA